MTLDLNADVGELPDEDALYPLVTSVNVACGGHAGDDASMARAVRLALAANAAVGAHPGYPDRPGFGRRSLPMPMHDLARAVGEQVGTLARICASAGARLTHVKPHGALYHDAGREEIAAAVADAVQAVDPALVLIGFPGSAALSTWARRGLSVAAEGFADRAYEPDGTLRPRGRPHALILDPGQAAEQALRLARAGAVRTICVHGDTPGAAMILATVRGALERAGVRLAPFGAREK